MSNEIRVKIERSEYDSDNDLIGGVSEDLLIESYDNNTCGSFSLIENSAYINIPFSQVTTASVLLVKSSQNIDIRLNNGSEIFNVSYFFVLGTFTHMELRNNNDSDTDIEYEIYGED